MKVIYTPKGRAREYSPQALNMYNGCDHDCLYCYNRMRNYFTSNPIPKKDIISKVEYDAKKIAGTNKQVMLCFMGDAYCKAEIDFQITRDVLDILLNYRIPTAILTKGGNRCLRDVNIFKQFGKGIKIGATLTFTNSEHSLHYEPGAAIPDERFETLKTLHESGIMTWVSLEPVVDISQSLEIIDITHSYVDHYKIGKMNGYNLGKNNPFNLNTKPDWAYFLNEAVKRMRKYDKEFYVKKDLHKHDKTVKVSLHEIDMDYLSLKSF